MNRFLNVGIIQMPVSEDTSVNLQYIEDKAGIMMTSYHRPELIVGVEGIGNLTPDYIPGMISNYFGEIAKKYGVYLIPGTLCEKSDELPEDMFYNTAAVFGPDGKLLGKYRKMAPWRPAEANIEPGKEYFVFDIPEKETKVGIQICYDLNFPEISRNETLLGAEVLIKLTMDPQELYIINRNIHFTRALENQAYLVSTNAVGPYASFNIYGNSMVISPEGNLIWEAGQEPCISTVTLDLDLVKRCREVGTIFMDHYMKHLNEYNFPAPFAGNVKAAPLYKSLGEGPESFDAYNKNVSPYIKGDLGKLVEKEIDKSILEKNLHEFLKKSR